MQYLLHQCTVFNTAMSQLEKVIKSKAKEETRSLRTVPEGLRFKTESEGICHSARPNHELK